ncbi:MAG: NirD/YgiW/YdeI family stress tolerance protein [Yoonia sp.]|uniref:NirD/YgiW/YdeI family stress tolerance protein n=1 Tax=Yoonia sp. TaxID=2212373 RepID=UPI00273ED060|nr:NirD/YgiW/YdeI family stress tolerance protein [Yoonia sp.]MDP5085578.1 NirD/YgiW/YdeI family stress tolerance protein [Yoonia sp.]MDP5361195.1 NirD/YgiW/YdeI family stress tolerance protein [Paracoccaceae bacterium]
MRYLATAALFAAITATAAQAETITPIADAARGTMVTVQGTVERITDEDEFRLADASGEIRIYVGPNWVPVDVGENVTVNGFVDDDPGPREIYARNLTRGDGTLITFDLRYD